MKPWSEVFRDCMLVLVLVGIVAIVIGLSGCDFAVYNYELEGYASQCEEHGGIAYISNLVTYVTCMDGTYIYNWSTE